MVKGLRKIYKVWDVLFNHFDILNKVHRNGSFIITSEEINTIGNYQARLATKFDTQADLPRVFKDYDLSLLPLSRGSYKIGHFNVFTNLKYDNFDTPIKKSFPDYVNSISPEDITSEAIALNIAHASGMIDDFIEEESSILTLSGRMGSGLLDFKIENKQTKKNDLIQVKNAQIEIDGGYEGLETLALIEAKNKETNKKDLIKVKNAQIKIDGGYDGLETLTLIEAKNNVPMDFIVRQLYYPFLSIRDKLPHKTVKPIFFTYTQSIFSFHEFVFNEPDVYSSIKKVKQKNYILDIFDDIEFNEIMDIYNNTTAEVEPLNEFAPFPQADYFGRVMNLLEYLDVQGGRSKNEIAMKYSFNERQSDYYWNALVYLGFGNKQNPGANRELNIRGKKTAKLFSLKDKKLEFVKALFKRGAFREYFEKVLQNNGVHLSDLEVENIMSKHARKMGNISVRKRRLLTLKSWVHWVFSLMKS